MYRFSVVVQVVLPHVAMVEGFAIVCSLVHLEASCQYHKAVQHVSTQAAVR
jgi:hypothetical protein